MAQLVTLANALLAVLPPAAYFFLAYGRYDGTFKDNVVFIYFIGGLIMGGFLGFMSLLSFALVATFLAVILLALLYPIAVVIGINRRKWQGERHAVFNGGAFGIGISVMLTFSLLYRVFKDVSPLTVGQGLLVAAGLGGIFFGLGLLAGDSVRRRAPIRVALLGTATVLAPVIFMGGWLREQAWLYPVLLAAYGITYAVVAERRLLIEGVSDEARKVRRRQRRARSGE